MTSNVLADIIPDAEQAGVDAEIAEELSALAETFGDPGGAGEDDIQTNPLYNLSHEDLETLYPDPLGPEGTRNPRGGARVRLWSMIDGTASDIPYYMAEAKLKQIVLNPNTGKRIRNFTARKDQAPELIPGTITCFFHKDNPVREEAILAGLAPHFFCVKANMRSQYDQLTHAQNRHGRQWQMVLDYRERQALDEEREFRQMQMRLMQRQLGEQPEPEAPVATFERVPEEEALPPVKATKPPQVCDLCGKEFKDGRGVAGHKRFKHKEG